jgi:transposase
MKQEIVPELNAEDKTLMENILAAGKIFHKFAVRILTVLNRPNGKGTNETAAMLGIHPMTVSLYVKRYNAGGIEALVADKTGKPGKAPVSEEVKNKICTTACTEKPENGTHWSTRSLAKKFGIGHDAVNRILRERDIKPHPVKKFGFSIRHPEIPNATRRRTQIIITYRFMKKDLEDESISLYHKDLFDLFFTIVMRFILLLHNELH